MNRYVKIQGDKFYFDGKPLHLTGIGVGSWLSIEHYMVGMPGTESMIANALDKRFPGFTAIFRDNFFTDKDAAYLKGLGINFIRVPVSGSLLCDYKTGKLNPEGFRCLMRLRDICDRNALFYLPDFHGAPGGQNPDWHSGCETGKMEFWQFSALRKLACELWQQMADVFSSSEYCLGYDVLNEPVLPDDDVTLLNDFHLKASEAIRKKDPNHIIFVEGNHFAMDFTGVKLPQEKQCAYTYHFYPTVWDESLFDEKMSPHERMKRMSKFHQDIISTMENYHGPLLCGETGPEVKPYGEKFAAELQRETIEVIESFGGSWCMWAYKDTGMIGMLNPKPDSLWKKTAEKISRSWNHHKAQSNAEKEIRRMGDEYFGGLSEKEVYQGQFCLRALWFTMEVDNFLLPEMNKLTDAQLKTMAADFNIDNCTVHKCFEQVMREKCLKNQ